LYSADGAAILDFGHTAIKRAVAICSGARGLDGLRLLEPVPTSTLASKPSASAATSEIEEIGRRVAMEITTTWKEAQALTGEEGLSTEIVCSVACYLQNGQPYPESTGTYAALRELSPDLGGWLSEQVSSQLGRAVDVRLIHDGTAAARAYPGATGLAVIMFGTALGVGFSSAPNELRELSPDFAVR
jgi:hypothetical protein